MATVDMVRRSLRLFRHQRLYSIAVAGTLALAVAAATASFAVVKRAFMDPLPYRDAGELVSLLTVMSGETSAVSAPVFEDVRGAGLPLVDFAPIDPEGVVYADGQTSAPLVAAYTSHSFFSTLGVQPALGRSWREGDRDVAVVSWAFWQTELGAVADAIGRQISINGAPQVVIGVLPEGFIPPYFTTAAVWMPLDVGPLIAGSGRARRSLSVIARLSPGATVDQLNSHLQAFSARLQQQHPVIHGRQTWVARPLREELMGAAGPVLVAVGAAASLLLLIVFTNMAGLCAARAVNERRQVAVRLALGASRGRVVMERLSDAVVLGLAGSVAGVWLGDLVVTVVAGYQEHFMPRLAAVAIDWPTAAGGVAFGVVVALLAAALPSGAGRVSSMEALRSSRSSAGSHGATVVRSTLVITQVALALVLLIGAGLLVRTVHHLSSTSLGFDADGLSIFTVTMPAPKYAAEARQLQFEADVLERLAMIPTVTAATASVGFPVVGSTRASLTIEGRPGEVGRDEVMYLSMGPEFRQVIGMRLLEGRDLAPTDRESAPPVVLVNETMARQYWPAGDAVGARVRIGPGTASPWITVIGIVADIRQHGPTQPVMATSFGSTLQYSWPRRHFTVRSPGSSQSLGDQIRGVVRAVDPDVPVGAIRSVDDMVHGQTGRHRLVMLALTFFGVVAAVLAAFGLYAVVALTSRMRRREFAIRIALGAPRQGVRWLVVRQALLLACAGASAGVIVAALGTRALTGLLHGVTPLDASTFTAAGIALMALAVLAAWIPARSAARVDPSEALRDG